MRLDQYICVILMCSIVFSCSQNKNKDSDIPAFDILLDDSTTVLNTAKISEEAPAVFIYFSTECEYCQQETEWLLNKIDSLKRIKFYYISIDPLSKIRSFKENYKLSSYKNLIIGRDYTFKFPKYFEIQTTPYIVLYNKRKKLKVIFSGKPDPEKFIGELNKL